MASEISIIITLSLIILLSPFLSKFVKIPTTPLEIIVGSIAGYFGFISSDNHFFELVAEFGFLYLMFLAGVEVNLKKLLKIDKDLFQKGLAYIFVLFLTSVSITYAFDLAKIFAITTPLISVGLIVALTKEYGKDEDWLKLSMTIGIIGEVVSICVLTFVAGALEFGLTTEFYKSIIYLFLFLLVFFMIFKSLRILFWWYPEIKTFLMPHFDKSEKDIRISMAIFFLTIAITLYLHLEVAFGAFLAGVFIATFFEHKTSLPHKLESFGFGFLVPIFFIYIGSSFKIESIFYDGLLLKAILIVIFMLFVRFLASFVFLNTLGFRKMLLFALSHSMPLTLLIAVATLAYHSVSISKDYYFAFILASLFEVIISMISIKLIKK